MLHSYKCNIIYYKYKQNLQTFKLLATRSCSGGMNKTSLDEGFYRIQHWTEEAP